LALQDDLIEFYHLDRNLRGLRSRLDAAIRRHGVQESRLAQLRQQHAELDQLLRATQAAAATLENDSNAMQEKVEKFRSQMNQVKTNKEYSALLVEVNTLKVDQSKAEEQALTKLAEADEQKARAEELDARIAEQQKVVEQATKEVESARAEIGDRLGEVEAERNQAAEKLPAPVLATFERLTIDHDGEAMAAVEEQDRRRMEYICGGCYMSIPIETINAVLSRRDELTQCTNCKRILYAETKLREAMAK